MSTKNDLTGKIFGSWKVLSKSTSKHGMTYWNCKCSCGKIVSVRASSLLSGDSSKCSFCASSENGKKNKGDDFYVASGTVMFQYKRNAKVRGLDFNLTREQVKEIISKNCFYCGNLPSNIVRTFSGRTKDDRMVYYNGIDRIDNTKGYTIDNCVPCCFQCNWSKSNLTMEQFLTWIKRIYINQYKKMTTLTPGQLIDSLFTVDYKCWWAQEKIQDLSLSEEERLKAAEQAQEYNAKRTSIIRTIDATLDFSDNTNTAKSYDKENK